ncbi:IS630 family transposase [Mucilaginibacter sp. AW1-7]|uniref:IS630 family transposase n=1 Tax=Mucilaginibacter sp. AW1-7 TaxID=3349874 RepID=UPI003F73D926
MDMEIYSHAKLKAIRRFWLKGPVNRSRVCLRLGICLNTLTRYLKYIKAQEEQHPGVFILPSNRAKLPARGKRHADLIALLPGLVAGCKLPKIENWPLWEAYHALRPEGYAYSGFVVNLLKWRREVALCPHAHGKIKTITPADADILQEWRNSRELDKWQKAVIIQGSYEGKNLQGLAEKVEVGMKCVLVWINKFKKDGAAGLIRKTCTAEPWAAQVKDKMEKLMVLLHEAPEINGFNRTSWCLRDLAIAFERRYGISISPSLVSVYIHRSGFVFKKAKVALTSPDPCFREKLDYIKSVLSALGPNERFFSIDEMGPVSVKLKGGHSYQKSGEVKIIPEFQKSRGRLIVTAAIELSRNQVTHFYSPRKDTNEMIRLIHVLSAECAGTDTLYLSWDAASWHSSKQLTGELERINGEAYRLEHLTPEIRLAPLPVTAQFLNVIESVFSGMAKSVLHNSDYPDARACQRAIDRYFLDRNIYFQKHPMRAGKKIWGKEIVIPLFSESNNCKSPRNCRP